MPGIMWEARTENRSKVENFKKCYLDHDIPVTMIAQEFGMDATMVSKIAGRMGLPFRRPRASNKPTEPPQVTLEAIDAEEQELKKRLFDLQMKRANMVVRVEFVDRQTTPDRVAIYGLASEPIETTRAYISNFLDGQGAGKLRDVVGRKS